MSRKTTSASEEYSRVYRMLSGLSTNISVVAFSGDARIRQFEAAAESDLLMRELVDKFRDRLSAIRGVEAFKSMAQAYEAFAETNFAFEMLGRGVRLERTPGTDREGQKRPDFHHVHGSSHLYFEVKALEIADPDTRNKEIAYDALEKAADLEQRAREPGVHFSESELSGFKPGMEASQRVDLIINRLGSVLKRDQLRYGPTMLVVDLGRLPGQNFGPSELLPVFYNQGPPAESCISGDLWHVALGRIGERIFALPEFDGKSNLDGHLTRQGILLDYPELCGVTFVRPRWSEPSELLTIWNPAPDQTKLVNKLTLQEHEAMELINKYSDGWNDARNEQGWRYRTCG